MLMQDAGITQKGAPLFCLPGCYSRPAKPEGRGAAITRKWAEQTRRLQGIAPLTCLSSGLIFWTESKYRGRLELSTGYIGYHFPLAEAKYLSGLKLILCRQVPFRDV